MTPNFPDTWGVKAGTDEIPEREQILAPYIDTTYYSKWFGGTRSFKKLPISKVELLIKKGYLHKGDAQNESPTAGEFLDFMKKWKKYNVTSHGYEVSAAREDCRVSIEWKEKTW